MGFRIFFGGLKKTKFGKHKLYFNLQLLNIVEKLIVNAMLTVHNVHMILPTGGLDKISVFRMIQERSVFRMIQGERAKRVYCIVYNTLVILRIQLDSRYLSI